MSVKVMSDVLAHSNATLGARLVLLVLADFAGDEHRTAWPSVKRIGEMAKLSERQVQYALRRLEDSGEIERVGQSQNATFVYRIGLEGGAKSAPPAGEGGAISGTGGVQPTAPEPELEPPEVLSEANASAQTLVKTFVDRSRAKGSDPPSRVIGQIARETKILIGDGVPAERILSAYDLVLERALHPSALASAVQQIGLNGGNGKPKSALSPLERARAWVQTVGWQYPDDALVEELGRFGLEGGQKRTLIDLAVSMQKGDP